MTRSCHSAKWFGDGESEQAGELSRPFVCNRPAPGRRASARRRANMSSMAAPYSRRNASGDRRSGQGTSACLSSLGIQLALPCRSHRALLGLGSLRRGSSSRSCQREVLAPRIHVAGSVNRDSESFVRETARYLGRAQWSVDRGVPPIAPRRPVRSRIRATAPGRAPEEDVEHQVGQGRSRVDFLHGSIGRRSPAEGWLTSNYSYGHYSGRLETSRLMACRRLAGISASEHEDGPCGRRSRDRRRRPPSRSSAIRMRSCRSCERC